MRRLISKNLFCQKLITNIFQRNYYRSSKIPPALTSYAYNFYKNEIAKKLSMAEFNPSFYHISLLKNELSNFFAKENNFEIQDFTKIIKDFVEKNPNNNSFCALEIEGLNNDCNHSIIESTFFKTLITSAILEYFGLKRINYNNEPAIGFLKGNYRVIPPHCDFLDDWHIPEIVAIVTIKSNSNAATYYFENEKIIEKFKSEFPDSFNLLSEVLLYRNRVVNNKIIASTPTKIIDINKDGSTILKYNFSNEPYQIFAIEDCKYKNSEVAKAINEFIFAITSMEDKYKFVLNHKNQILIFKNNRGLHSRSSVKRSDIREMVYLPFEYEIANEEKPKNIISNADGGFEYKKINFNSRLKS